MEEFGLRIKTEMKKKGKTQQQIADETGISIPGLSLIMNGKTMPTLKNVVKIANALDTTVGYLLGETGMEYGKMVLELEDVKARLKQIETILVIMEEGGF